MEVFEIGLAAVHEYPRLEIISDLATGGPTTVFEAWIRSFDRGKVGGLTRDSKRKIPAEGIIDDQAGVGLAPYTASIHTDIPAGPSGRRNRGRRRLDRHLGCQNRTDRSACE